MTAAEQRGFSRSAIDGRRAHASWLIGFANNGDISGSLQLRVATKAIHRNHPVVRPEKKADFDVMSVVTNLGNHPPLDGMATEPLNCLGLPLSFMFSGARMNTVTGMMWEVAKRTAKGWDFLLPGKTSTDLEYYHLLHTPSHPGIDPASVIDELYARAKAAAGGKDPTGPLWRTPAGRALSEKQVRKRILLSLRQCGYKGTKPNVLRAAVMSKLIAAGVPAPDVARFVHHSLTSTVQFTRYKFSDGDSGATAALLAEISSRPTDG
jgi:hypothetical protein